MVKPISPAPLSAAASGFFSFFDVARDVLDHHNRIVHHETRGDSERHQRQVINGKNPKNTITAKVPISDSGTATPGIIVAGILRKKQIDNHDDQRDRQHQFKLGIAHGSANIGGAIGQDRDLHRFRQAFGKLGQHLANAVRCRNDIGAGLALNVHH